jgi:N-acylneuraminate cytidylyltransferase
VELRGASVLVLIPARGGSKSIPRKNLRPLGGFPLLAWSIAAAREGGGVGRVLVSTDDPEIREVASTFGAEAPFLRPAALAQDDTPDLPVFLHALEWLAAEEGYRPRVVVQLRPTSPLRPRGLVRRAVEALVACSEADSLRGVAAPGQNPYKMWRRAGRWLVPLLEDAGPEAYNKPRQALPETLWQTGHVDVIRRATLIEQRSMSGERILPLPIEPAYAVDIDTPQQLQLAEWLLAHGELDLVRPATPRPDPPALAPSVGEKGVRLS